MPTSETVVGVPVYVPIIVACVTALPLIISPIVAWALGRSNVSKETATIDYLNKRLDLLERVNKLQAQFAEGPMKPLMETEIEQYHAFLRQRPTYLAHGEEVRALPQTRLARFVLAAPAPTFFKRVFKGAFYLFFGLGIICLVPAIWAGVTGDMDAALGFGLAFFVYGGLGLLFRWAAR